MDIWEEIRQTEEYLLQAHKDLVRLMYEKRDAERAYQTAKSKAAFLMHDKGYPQTMINATLKGLSDVVDLLTARDLAKDLVDAKKEDINIHKKILDDLETEMRLEWSSNK